MLQNRDAELMALGMALVDAECAQRLATLPMDTFSYPETQAVFLGVRKIVEAHGTPDVVTTYNACTELGLDPATCIIDATKRIVTTANYRQYETILLGLRKRRNLIRACSEAIKAAQDDQQDIYQLTAQHVEALQDANGNRTTAVSAMDAAVALFESLEKKDTGGCYTGIAGYDRLTGGVKPGQLIVLGARPGVGKTALALQIAAYVSQKSGQVLVCSLEMDQDEVMVRLLADQSGVDVQRMENRAYQAGDWDKIAAGITPISNYKLWITESARTPLQVRREAQTIQRNGGLKLIVIDYIQLLRADSETGSRYEQITQISRELKLMAMELKVPVLALTQFNRESEAHAGMKKRKPSMAEAKDSGSIEQDANVFLTLFSPDEPKEKSGYAEDWEYCKSAGFEWQLLCVDKNRQGRTGSISLGFDKPHMRHITIERFRKEGSGEVPQQAG